MRFFIDIEGDHWVMDDDGRVRLKTGHNGAEYTFEQFRDEWGPIKEVVSVDDPEAPAKCEDCGHVLRLEVLRSSARSYVGTCYYIGTECYCGPYSIESGYYRTHKQAERALVRGEHGRWRRG